MAKMDDEAEENEPQVAVPGMEVACGHQQKLTLRLIRRRCVLTQATSFLRPVRPVRPVLRRDHPLRPLRPDPPSNPPLRPDEISPRPGALKTSQL